MSFATRGVLEVIDADGVRLLRFDRPEALNAFSQALWEAVTEALADAAEDDTIHCVVLTGNGRAFTAGMDLTEMADTEALAKLDTPGYQLLMPVLETFPKPLLAAVNGVGVGIGMTMLPHCDIALIATSARLKAPFVSLGVTTEAAASVTLPAVAGWQRAAHLLFTEPWVDAERAVELGLALEVVPDDEVLERTMAIARTIATMPLASLVATKEMLVAGRIDALRAARLREERVFERLVGEAANAAALADFTGKG